MQILIKTKLVKGRWQKKLTSVRPTPWHVAPKELCCSRLVINKMSLKPGMQYSVHNLSTVRFIFTVSL